MNMNETNENQNKTTNKRKPHQKIENLSKEIEIIKRNCMEN